MTLRRRTLVSLAGLGLLVFAVSLAAKKPKPQPCPEGRFLVTMASPIGQTPGAIRISSSQLSVSSGCPAVPVRPKVHKTFTSVIAKWRGCPPALAGRVTLRATIEAPDCNTMTGVFKARKAKVNVHFEAHRSLGCGDGIFDPGGGEQCDAGQGCPGDQQCTSSCTCKPPIITGTTTTTTRPSSTTTTRLPRACGDGRIDLPEQCDPPGSLTCPPTSPGGAFLECGADCSCPKVTRCPGDPTNPCGVDPLAICGQSYPSRGICLCAQTITGEGACFQPICGVGPQCSDANPACPKGFACVTCCGVPFCAALCETPLPSSFPAAPRSGSPAPLKRWISRNPVSYWP